MSFAPVHTSALHALPSDNSDDCGFLSLVDNDLRKVGITGSGLKAGLTPEEKERLIKAGSIVSIAPLAPKWTKKTDLIRRVSIRAQRAERNARILKMLKAECTYLEIAQELGCSHDTIRSVRKQHLGLRPILTPAQLRAELEAMRAKKHEGETDHAAAKRLNMYARFTYLRSLETKGKI